MAMTCGQIGGKSNDPPSEPGWYATMHSWDAEDGAFPGAHFWAGTEWQPETKAGIIYWPILFASKDEAERYADEHDAEG